jgi:hypothetical protein
VTDGLASYGAAKARVPELAAVEHLRVRAAARLNNRVEQSQPGTRPGATWWPPRPRHDRRALPSPRISPASASLT